MFVIIAAIGKNYELGKNNKLIWNIPSDLKFFKQTTLNKTIIMGRKTFESLPGVLPNRKHIILTNNTKYISENENVLVFNNIEEIKNSYHFSSEEIYIIGGSTIYSQFLPLCDKMLLTEIDAIDDEADVFFPKFNKNEWDFKILKHVFENNLNYKHVEYIKR